MVGDLQKKKTINGSTIIIGVLVLFLVLAFSGSCGTSPSSGLDGGKCRYCGKYTNNYLGGGANKWVCWTCQEKLRDVG
jgi:hypothetical protein